VKRASQELYSREERAQRKLRERLNGIRMVFYISIVQDSLIRRCIRMKK
jgi:hypothetical protein